jgi:hypothetical protein
MATRYVDPGSSAGGDGTTNALSGATRAYASLTAWEAARQAVLSEVEEVICSCQTGAADTSAGSSSITIDGWTTTSSFYIDLKVDPAYRHAGAWDNTKFRITGSNSIGPVMSVGEDWTRVTGLQAENSNSGGGGIHALSGVSSGIRYISCIVRSTVSAAGVGLWITGNGGTANNFIINCIAYGYSGTGGIGIYTRSATAARSHVYNCTVYGNATGFRMRDAFALFKNNLAIGNTATISDAGILTGSTNNAYDQGTNPFGANAANSLDLTSYTDAQIFVNAAGGDFHLVSGSPAIEAGADLSADAAFPFDFDIDGQTRTAPWDIGADEQSVTVDPPGTTDRLAVFDESIVHSTWPDYVHATSAAWFDSELAIAQSSGPAFLHRALSVRRLQTDPRLHLRPECRQPQRSALLSLVFTSMRLRPECRRRAQSERRRRTEERALLLLDSPQRRASAALSGRALARLHQMA